MIEIKEHDGNFVWLRATGKLHDEDYRQIIPQIEQAIDTNGTVCVLLELDDFRGWDTHAAWDDFRFVMKHHRDIERIAIVGDKRWEKLLARLARPFVEAEQQYFDRRQLAEAQSWLAGSLAAVGPPCL